MNETASIRRAISFLGGPVRAAEKLGISRYQTVQQWVLNGSVPPKYCPEIEKATHGEVRCEDIRPDVDWGFLRGTVKSVDVVSNSPSDLAHSDVSDRQSFAPLSPSIIEGGGEFGVADKRLDVDRRAIADRRFEHVRRQERRRYANGNT